MSEIGVWDSGTEWLRGEGQDVDVVMSSRIRLARNLAGFPFLSTASAADARQILDLCRDRINAAKLAERMIWIDLHGAHKRERRLLMERHLISAQHVKGRQSNGAGGADTPRAVAVAVPAEQLSIMVNEEDHLRIQTVRTGLTLSEAFAQIDDVDDRLEAGLDFAFSSRFGYLTACPTNVGTGIRVSLMLHLPGLALTGEIQKAQRAARDMGLAVRGFYGEGSEAAGDFYQISNQTTLGKSEQVIMHEFQHEIIPQIISYERSSRRKLFEKRRVILEDQVFRALGCLRHARMMSVEEAMKQLSLVRLGVLLGLTDGLQLNTVNRLMLLVQPAHLERLTGHQQSQAESRVERASLLRSKLTG